MHKLPIFDHVGTTTATAYHFNASSRGGWAICTINDRSHELAVQSDWGSWSFRWSAAGMPRVGKEDDGRRMTLTDFLAARDPYHCHYVADKLMTREQRERFCPERSVRALGLCLRDARRAQRINREEHIAIAEGLVDLVNIDDQRDFVEAWYQIDGHEIVEPEPWDSFRSEDSNEYLILRDAILPALVRLLIAQRAPQAPQETAVNA